MRITLTGLSAAWPLALGRAHLCAAVTRPPLIGGESARYPEKIR